MKRAPFRTLALGAVIGGLALTLTACAPGITTMISVNQNGNGANDNSNFASISADGRYVAFNSKATDIVPDNDRFNDVFVRDTNTNVTTKVTVNPQGGAPSGGSFHPSISGDGHYVAFASSAHNLTPAPQDDEEWGVYVRDMVAGVTTRLAGGVNPEISDDGRYVAFLGGAFDGCAPFQCHSLVIKVHDRATGTTTPVDVDPLGGLTDGDTFYDYYGVASGVSGPLVTFSSKATNLVPGDTNDKEDVFLRDVAAGLTTRISVDTTGGDANGDSVLGGISADGNSVAFHSLASDLVAVDGNGFWDVFVRDIGSGTTRRVSIDTNGGQANGESQGLSPLFAPPHLSHDGRYITFISEASDLVAGDGTGGPDGLDVFVRDMVAAKTTRISVDANGGDANNISYIPDISADGLRIAFTSRATNLAGSALNSWPDVFLRQLSSPPSS